GEFVNNPNGQSLAPVHNGEICSIPTCPPCCEDLSGRNTPPRRVICITLKLGSSTGVDDAALDVISHCAPLEFLELVNCRRISDAGIIALLRGQPAVRALLLGGCTGLTDTTCHALAGLRELEDLRLVRCEALTDEGVAAVGQIVSLEHLNLNDSTGVGSKTVRAVARLPRLRELRLAGTAPISDEALRELGEAQTLEALSLAEHRDIGAAGLFEICGLERLVELGLRHCLNLVDDELAELARRPTLRVL